MALALDEKCKRSVSKPCTSQSPHHKDGLHPRNKMWRLKIKKGLSIRACVYRYNRSSQALLRPYPQDASTPFPFAPPGPGYLQASPNGGEAAAQRLYILAGRARCAVLCRLVAAKIIAVPLPQGTEGSWKFFSGPGIVGFGLIWPMLAFWAATIDTNIIPPRRHD